MVDQIIDMNTQLKEPAKSVSIIIAAVIALVFGALTIFSGGQALFGDQAAREAVGAAVPFVLWFNFIAGFVYIFAAIGLLQRARWAVWLSALIAMSTLAVFLVLGAYIWLGGAYEIRTVGAMVIRSVLWTVIAALAWPRLRLAKAGAVRVASWT